MCKQFAAGERVVYGKMGVCLVTDRQVMAFGGESEEYYILQPQRDPRSSIYVPCGNALLMAKLRPLLSKEEIDTILQGVPRRISAGSTTKMSDLRSSAGYWLRMIRPSAAAAVQLA